MPLARHILLGILLNQQLEEWVAPQPAEHSPPPGRGLLIVATTSGEAGKRDQAQNEGQIRKIPRRSKVNPFAYQLDFA